ncbi:MAG: hypothetical protein V3R95_05770 [Dehalococcoidia bacterium]
MQSEDGVVSVAFSHLPLWVAWWNGREDFEGVKSFGGWDQPEMKQFAADTKVWGGVHADLNVYGEAAVTAPPPVSPRLDVSDPVALAEQAKRAREQEGVAEPATMRLL